LFIFVKNRGIDCGKWIAEFGLIFKGDELVKSQKVRFPVIPANPGSGPGFAGIQLFQTLKNSLDSGFHRNDDFLRDHQGWKLEMKKMGVRALS
jgi:hypothetical protein